MQALLRRDACGRSGGRVVELGLHHEQQHQELLLTDLLHLLSCNPLQPAYRAAAAAAVAPAVPLHWLPFDGGLAEIGHDGRRFCLRQRTARGTASGCSPMRWPIGW